MSMFAPNHIWQSVSVNGENVAYYTVGQGPAVVSIPGWAMSGNLHWRKAIALAENGLSAVVISQSSKHPNISLSFEQLAKRNWQVLDLLGVNNPVIAGHSMGGITAMHMAAMRHIDVNQLWLLESAGGSIWKQSDSQVLRLSERSTINWWVRGLIPLVFRRFGPSLAVEFLQSVIKNPKEVLRQSNLVRYVDITNIAKILKDSRLAIHGLWVNADSVFPSASSRSLAQALNVDYRELPGKHGELLINPYPFIAQLSTAMKDCISRN